MVLLAGLFLLAGCTLTGSSSKANRSPTTSAVALASPSTSPSSSPTTATETPTSSPSSSPSSAAAPTITSLPFHNGEVGVSYGSFSLGASGGTPPYQWSIASGAFSSGITLTSDGTVSGTPGSAGHFGFTIRVTDSAGASASTPGSFGIASALAVTQPCAGTCAVEQGCTICGAFGSVGGGVGPYHYQITTDNRPTGMGVNGLTLTNAFPSPDPVSNFDLTVLVSDQYGAQKFVSAKWYVFQHITFTQTSATCGNSPSSCSLQIPYVGGTLGATPKVRIVSMSTTLSLPSGTGGCGTPVTQSNVAPPGWAVSAGNGNMSLAAGPPDFKTWCQFSGTITFVLVDQSPCGPGNCTSNILSVLFGL